MDLNKVFELGRKLSKIENRVDTILIIELHLIRNWGLVFIFSADSDHFHFILTQKQLCKKCFLKGEKNVWSDGFAGL